MLITNLGQERPKMPDEVGKCQRTFLIDTSNNYKMTQRPNFNMDYTCRHEGACQAGWNTFVTLCTFRFGEANLVLFDISTSGYRFLEPELPPRIRDLEEPIDEIKF